MSCFFNGGSALVLGGKSVTLSSYFPRPYSYLQNPEFQIHPLFYLLSLGNIISYLL